MQTWSIQGNSYHYVLVDDYTCYKWISFLWAKSDTFDCFKKFHVLASTHYKSMLWAIHLDHGGEFLSMEFSQYIREKGIKHELTAPHTPLMSMDADPNMYPILILPASNTFHFCHHPQPHHSQPYHAQSIIYHPSFIINGNSWYQAYSTTVSIFPIFSRLPSLIHPPPNSVKWSSPQNDSCHRRYSPIQNISSTMHIFRNEANSPSWW